MTLPGPGYCRTCGTHSDLDATASCKTCTDSFYGIHHGPSEASQAAEKFRATQESLRGKPIKESRVGSFTAAASAHRNP